MALQFSLIIPTLNRADLLPFCLDSIMQLNFEAEKFEVIIVDNGSTDNTKEIANNFFEKSKINYTYLFEPEPGLLSGRHLGAKNANASIFVFLDDDVILSPNYLNALEKTFINPKAKLVGGKCLPYYLSDPPMWFKELWHADGTNTSCGFLSLIDQGDIEKECDPFDVWGLNFSIRKEIFYELGGFNPDNISKQYQKYQGDGESGLARKLIDKKYKAFYSPEVCVQHIIPANRLTEEYVYNRAYYQGVCNSYTEVRNKSEVNNIQETFLIKIKNKLRPIIYKLGLKKAVIVIEKNITISPIQEKINKGLSDGFNFHQNELKNDPELIKWVLKPNYLDYKLPIKND